mmetsp:Transcript_9400/g.14254  ORF Transcript_9400/g.14254 Transcript_9400/m.14254 type:complete len:258 (-) Transcript_9400:11-784(-)
MFLFQSLVSALCEDHSSIGKFDTSLLSDQSLFELLVDGFMDTSLFKDDIGDYKDISTLTRHLELDANERVTSIDFFTSSLRGTLLMQYLPRHLKRLDFYSNELYGVFEVKHMPPIVRFARFKKQHLEGNLELSLLPQSIRFFDLSDNKMNGSLVFDSLPTTLEVLLLSDNNFEGVIDLQKLKTPLGFDRPEDLLFSIWRDEPIQRIEGTLILRLNDNNFEGTILVRDVSEVKNTGIFRRNKCKLIVDIDGNTMALTK